MAGNNDDLQKMYEYQQMKGKDCYEYVVRGAEVFCGQGSQSCVMQLPKDHRVYTSDERPLIRNTDIGKENISGFGICKITGKKCIPKLENWTVNTSNLKIDNKKTKKVVEYAVERNSTATCKWGGVVICSTSGQTSPDFKNSAFKDAIEVVEDVKGSWTKVIKENTKDFLGHIKVGRSGIYNFGIKISNKEKLYTEGSIFIYRKELYGTLKYIGTYTIEIHSYKKEGLYDWNCWAEIILSNRGDYYIEIDIPSVDKFDYKLVGNWDTVTYTGGEVKIDGISYSGGMYWGLDKSVELLSEKVYELQNVSRFCIYIDRDYVVAIYDLICRNYTNSNMDTFVDKAWSVLKGLAIVKIGLEYTEAGVVLSIFDIILSLSEDDSIKLARKIKPYADSMSRMKLVVLVMHPGTITDNYFDDDNPYRKLEQYVFLVETWDGNNKIKGEKYFKGKFTPLKRIRYLEEKKAFEENMQEIINVLSE